MRNSLIALLLVMGCASSGGVRTMWTPPANACDNGTGHDDDGSTYNYALVCVGWDDANKALVANPQSVHVKVHDDIFVILTDASRNGELDVQFTNDTPMQSIEHTHGSANEKRHYKATATARTSDLKKRKYTVIDRVSGWMQDPDVMIDP
ncbi:MAG TPA: hypothetical protein VI391_01240 [Thermoanaerobaculia bacterium]